VPPEKLCKSDVVQKRSYIKAIATAVLATAPKEATIHNTTQIYPKSSKSKDLNATKVLANFL